MAVLRRVSWLYGLGPYALAAVFFLVGSGKAGDQDRMTLRIHWPVADRSGGEERTLRPPQTVDAGRSVSARARSGKHSRLEAAGDDGAEQLIASGWVDRSAKGDRTVSSAAMKAERREAVADASAEAGPGAPSAFASIASGLPFHTAAMSFAAEASGSSAQEGEAEIAAAAAEPAAEPQDAEGPFGTAWLYFGSTHMNATPGTIERWAEGEAPIVDAPVVVEQAVAVAPEAAPKPEATLPRLAEVPLPPARTRVVPASLLGLEGRSRTRAERCLANAVYFEARSEPVRGQIAVAQVVLNRAFSGYYPDDVCGVVYQNANRHLSCQFTFACDGIPDVVTEPEPWRRAQRIAKAALDGKLWLADVGKATHYHASYVNPYWVRSMRRLRRIGLHTFYRPHRWGNGADAPSWGSPAHAEIAANL